MADNYSLSLTEKLERIEQKLDLLLENNQSLHSTEEMLDVVDVASICKVAHRTVYNWVGSGKIACFKANGRLLFKRTEVEEFISRREKRKPY